MHQRPLNLPELGLLIYLLRDAPEAEHLLAALHTVRVTEVAAEATGSLRFLSATPHRRLGQQLATTQFLDEDGVPVLVSLYLDQVGELYELDCWKVDDTPVKRIPAF
ncbi:hypothetical protein K3G63_03390 [Hymenobacter sp. HSC-4F20]|uniref:DUF6984 family protein n=1 Tax=Hymenobacter sp. HSC-4F20 TaxID=2864135 RepID=UPI001C72FEC5|nr:hypothetical protein [Hymenobacter sp. HSC-4F20]MBX0289463.1 hypothetical protein [Hymenobacter sp. HSC-4F20]